MTDQITLEKNASLLPYNTFRIDCKARYLAHVCSLEELRELRDSDIFPTCKRLVLGGGSNLLFTGDFDGLVIHNQFRGIEVIDENEDFVWLHIQGGENWHEVVSYCVENGWGGIENLALIPGSVGAAPIQNIGAYGVEIQDVFVSLEAFIWETGDVRVYFKKDCDFAYRNSIFKTELKGKSMVLSVTLKLTQVPVPNVSYGAIGEVLQKKGVSEIKIKDVYEAVIDIRRSKLPDPEQIGNAGSFFKNPELPTAQAKAILEANPGAPHYVVSEEVIKIPAGWLIEKCGWKGHKKGNIGVHDRQALVLVNFGGGDGQSIQDLAMEIKASVKEKFGVDLTPEVNIID